MPNLQSVSWGKCTYTYIRWLREMCPVMAFILCPLWWNQVDGHKIAQQQVKRKWQYGNHIKDGIVFGGHPSINSTSWDIDLHEWGLLPWSVVLVREACLCCASKGSFKTSSWYLDISPRMCLTLWHWQNKNGQIHVGSSLKVECSK